MADSPPSLDELRRFLHTEMKILDKAWEDDLDDVWAFAPAHLFRDIGSIADKFYQEYWELFRAVLQENSGKSWEEMKREGRMAANSAQDHICSAWLRVVGDKIDATERQLADAKNAPGPLVRAKQLFRKAKDGQTKAEKQASHNRHHDAISKYREAIGLINECDDEIDEALRQGSVITNHQKATWKTIHLTKKKLVIMAISVVVGIAGLVFAIVKYLQRSGAGQQ